MVAVPVPRVVVVDLAAAQGAAGEAGVHLDAVARRRVDDLITRVALQLEADARGGVGSPQGPEEVGSARRAVRDY